MLKIGRRAFQIRSIGVGLESLDARFSSIAEKLNEQTFSLLRKRLEEKTLRARKMEETLIQAANDDSIRVNSEAMRMELNKMSPLLAMHEELSALESNIADLQQMISETSQEDERLLLKEQLASIETRKEELKESALELLVPSDAYDDVSEIQVEFRPGAGGSESAVFVEDISGMFIGYAESMGWRVSTISSIKETVASRGFKYLKLKIHGEDCYKIMKCEAGVHKVIRVPETESKGRLHSSTISMVVMPSIPFSFNLNPKDIKYQYCRSSGAGGQSVNKTDSACRATYLPTGLSVFIQEERSQDQNRKRATEILKEKLFEAEYKKTIEEEMARRKQQVGTMDRSEKIRTYNYPQDRITDHRTGLTLFGIDNMMSGNLLQQFIDAYRNKVYETELEELILDLQSQKKAAQL